MAKEFRHKHNTPNSHLLIPRIQEMLGASGNQMKVVLGTEEEPLHDQSWSYLRNGAKIQPYIVERLLTFLTLQQFATLKTQLIKEQIEQEKKGEGKQ